WEQRKLKSISNKVTLKNKEHQDFPVLTNSAQDGIVNQETFFDRKIANNTNDYYIVKPDDFIYNPRISKLAPYGPIRRNKLEITGVMSPLYYVFSLKSNTNKDYLSYYFISSTWYKFMIENGNTGARSDRFAIKDSIFQRMPIMLPIQNEQTKIGKLFNIIDKDISLQQRKLDLLKQLKKGLLQKMFADKNNKQPVLRFDGFSGDWEQRKLGEVAKVTMGQSPSSKYYTTNPNDHILIQGNADLKSGKVVPRVWTKEITKSVHNGEIIMTVRAPVGYLAIASMNAVIGRGVAAIEGDKYLFYLLQTKLMNNTWKRISSGSTFESISSNDIKKLKVTLPKDNERNSISKLMDVISHLLSLQQRRLGKLTYLKKFFLQKLFI
ncbi:restriction endonuclease subunit S, partial [Limosilactobacillus fastidiosus]